MTVGNQASHLATAELLGQVPDSIAAIYAARAGGSPAEWRPTMRQEGWCSASEAVAAGVADRVAEVPAPTAAVARMHWAKAAGHRFSVAGVIREQVRARLGHADGVMYARAGGPARRPVGRRPVLSALPVVGQLRAARQPAPNPDEQLCRVLGGPAMTTDAEHVDVQAERRAARFAAAAARGIGPPRALPAGPGAKLLVTEAADGGHTVAEIANLVAGLNADGTQLPRKDAR